MHEFLKTFSYFPARDIAILEKTFNEEPYRGGIINELFIDLNSLKKRFDIITKTHGNNFFYYTSKIGDNLYHQCGAFYLFDPSANEAMSLIKNTHKKVILDACASPGGKTIKLALENPDSLIISNEISFSRYKVLKENIERMGLKNVIATNHSLDFFLNDFKNYFDIVILDAPCSGSGMYRKQKEVLLDWSMDKVYRLSKLQKELIDIAANLITPSGQLIYSTCSFSKEEDEDVKDYFLNKHQNFSSIKVNADECYFSLDDFNSIHFLPSRFAGEGHYLAMFKNNSVDEKRLNKVEFNKTSRYKINDEDYMLDHYFTFYNKLSTSHIGVKVNSKQEKSTYSYAYGRAYGYEKVVDLKDENLAKKFMHGEEIDYQFNDFQNKEILVKYNELRLGFGKASGNKIKNYIPKRVRLMKI